jgi:DnaJ like chaperone protein
MAVLLDYKYYKWIAIIPGWILGDIVGAIAAYFFVETLMADKKGDLPFEVALLRICTLLIKTDGVVDDSEVRVVREFFVRTFGKRRAEVIFKEIKTSEVKNYTIDQLVSLLKKRIAPSKYYSVIQMLYAVAVADGDISPSEDAFIETIGRDFGYTLERLKTIRSQFVKSKSKSTKYSQEIIDALSTLGLKTTASFADIKKAYRELAKEYHPDKLAGMSQGIQDLAKEKFQQIQNAYEYLNKHYV